MPRLSAARRCWLLAFALYLLASGSVLLAQEHSGESLNSIVELGGFQPAPPLAAKVRWAVELENSGSLATGDPAFSGGEFYHAYEFDGQPGQTVTIDLNSSAFDTYLVLEAPGGEWEANDDADGTSHSRIVAQLTQPGTYRVYVSSYAAAETGSYLLTIKQSMNGRLAAADRGSLYGVFAGISDYPGDDDLVGTDQDALRVRDALLEGAGMDPGNAYTLIDAEATLSNFIGAIGRIGATIGRDDTLVIFFSGHGSQHERATGPNNTDPDGIDEGLVLYDGYLLDDELAALLDNMNAGRVLLVFDSCYSGGFAKDVVSAPGRMGLFSSEEDVSSHVAHEFEAGGYLAVFFEDAVRGRFADGDMNRQLTARELSEYIHERYRFDVKPEGSEAGNARVNAPAAVYQHLVVDRGGITADSVLFYH